MFKRLMSIACAAVVLAMPATLLASKIKIRVIPALAPNVFGSPSWSAWAQNAVYAIYNNLDTYGDQTQPTFYRRSPHSLAANQIIVTGFASWLGNADPANDYGPQFAGEYGNRLHFGLHIWGNGQKFSVAQLAFNAYSTDPSNALGFSFPAGSYDYSPDRIGIIYNPDGSRTFITTPGNPFQLVDELVSRGSGNAYAVYDTPDFPGTTLQDKINNFEVTIPKMSFVGMYSINAYVGQAKVEIRPGVKDHLDNDFDKDGD